MRALQRQWLLLSQIPRAPRAVDSAVLEVQLREAGFPIHRRTIQRDLLALSQMFPLVCDERAKPFAWSWSRDAAALTIPSMGFHTALIFKLAADVLAPQLPTDTQAFLSTHLPLAVSVLAMSGLELQGANQVVPTSTEVEPANAPRFAVR